MPCKDITGQKFNLLTAEKLSHMRNGRSIWICRCDCGNKTEVSLGNLTSKRSTKSCGCLNHLKGEKSSTYKHGKTETEEYIAYAHIKSRCYNKNNKKFKIYGERGITVCERWLESFENFYADMGPRPSTKHSIDRINVNGNYEPGNCRWANATIQARNQNPRKDNKSGCRGVHFDNKKNKWISAIGINKKYKQIGYFESKEQAIAARKEAEIKYWGENR
jgi:hypothetical protein